MASNITHLPHIRNVQSGVNYYDPQHNSIFEVYFSLPEPLREEFKSDEAILTEQVISVSGLDVLQKIPTAGSQQFYGVDVSFLNPTYDSTYADITIQFNLNLRNATDNFVLKVFKAWGKLSYDLSDGTRTLKAHYIADNLRVAEANRDGTIWRSYIFHDVMITGITGLETLDYKSNDPQKLTVVFRSDYWDEDLA